MDWGGDPIKSGYLNFDPGGLYKIKWRPTRVQVSEYKILTRGNPSPDPR